MLRRTGVVSFSAITTARSVAGHNLRSKIPSRVAERINFGKIKEVITPPNLIEIKINSYVEFLQACPPPSKRNLLGLQACFREVFPIASYDGKTELYYHSSDIGEPNQA